MNPQNGTEKIYLCLICYYLYSFSLFFLPTRLMCSPAILAHQRFPNLLFFLLFISSLPTLLPSSYTTLPSPSAANCAAHLLRQEVWSQREPGDCEPAGQLPVRTFPPGDAEPELVLGERVRRARRRGQPVGHAAHILPLLLTAGPGQSRRLTAGEPEGSQLQVSFVNYTPWSSSWDTCIHIHRCTSVE